MVRRHSQFSKARLLAVLPLFWPQSCFPIESDKVAHAAGSYAVAITAEPFLEATEHPVLNAFAVGMLPGIVKYIDDRGHDFDAREKNQDMAANILGAALGAVIGHEIQLQVTTRQIRLSKRF